MLKNSSKFFEAFDGEERSDLSVRLTINGQVYSNQDIFSINYDSGSMQGDQLEIGSSYSNSIKVTFCDTITSFKELDKVVVELGIKREPLKYGIIPGEVAELGYAPVGTAPVSAGISEALKSRFDVRGRFTKADKMYLNRWNAKQDFEYSRMGEFYISEQIDVNWNERTTSLECSDALVFTESDYRTNLRYPAQLRDMVKEAGANVGLILDYVNYDQLPNLSLEKLTGELTNRQALEKLSHFIVGYVRINRFGFLELKSFVESNYTINPEYYFSKGLTKNDIRYKISGITCSIVGESETIQLYSGNREGPQINIENNLMTQTLLDNIYTKLANINYYPYSLSWRGNPALEVGDYITVSDLKGNIYKTPNISYRLDFNGSLKATSSANTVSLTEVVSSDRSPLLKNLKKAVNDVKVENVTIAQKVKEVNVLVERINDAIEDADLAGIKRSIGQLLVITETFADDIEELESKVDNFAIPTLKIAVGQLRIDFDALDIPSYGNVSTQNNGLFTKENFQIFLNHINYLNEIINGTGWLNLASDYTTEIYAPRYRKRNKRVELQFSLKGFTAEGQIAVTLPVGSRSTILLQKSAITTSGKTALVTIGIDGSVKLTKVFGFNGVMNEINSADIFMLDVEFPID